VPNMPLSQQMLQDAHNATIFQRLNSHLSNLTRLLSKAQTVTRDAKCSHQSRFASGTAAMLVLPDLELDVVWAVATSAVLASGHVKLI